MTSCKTCLMKMISMKIRRRHSFSSELWFSTKTRFDTGNWEMAYSNTDTDRYGLLAFLRQMRACEQYLFCTVQKILWRDNLKQDCLVQQCSEIILLIHFFIGCMCVSGYTLVIPYLYHFQRKPVSSLQMNDHIEESFPYTKVQCTFALVGCQVKVCCVISATKKCKLFSVFFNGLS